jgi:CubicO group peptidase (beta-lactamase class C family)
MMKCQKLGLFAVVILVTVFCVELSYGQQSQIQSFIEDYLLAFPNNTEVAIGIVDGTNTYKLGYRLNDGKLIPLKNETTLFEIGSITKVFTSALLMQGVKEKRIALDDPLQKHLPFRMKQDVYQNHSLLILHLVTHTSGLKKNPLMSYKRYSRYLKGFELTYIPGKKWEYNNLAVSLAGKLSEKDKSSWDISLRENILKPLGMNSTYTNIREAPKTNRVQCVNRDGTKGDCYFHKMESFQWPNGGIISNVNDMLTWVKVNLESEGPNRDLDFIQMTHNPLADTIAIPWFQLYRATQGIVWWHYRTDLNNRIICHGGNMPAQTSFIAFDKEKKRGVIILANVSGKALINGDKVMKTTDLAIRILGL